MAVQYASRNPSRTGIPPTPNEMRRDSAKDIGHIKELLKEAWRTCTIEYFQLIIKHLVDPTYAQKFIKSTLHDLVVFKTFSQELDGTAFGNRQVWRAWYYIEDLVKKYIPKNGDKYDPRITSLNSGLKDSLWFGFTKSFTSPPKAIPDPTERPDARINEAEWKGIPEKTLKKLLDEASKDICGREGKQTWRYEDIFDEHSDGFKSLFGQTNEMKSA
jgi:hypothetical protein